MSRAMAASRRVSVFVAALVCCSLVRLSRCGGGGGGQRAQNYTSMFSFGDSLTDTGNLVVSSPLSFSIVGKYPYGMTYFHRPTGRCSDGRLVVDFLGARRRRPPQCRRISLSLSAHLI
jgi:hypothetical protein